ncbi:MAG TPA: D-glycerate dehydrogenase, partial [Polyangiaceae bacterium]|nr:D-glycerate dehydrogenase [Polyangiaceae bacterium]
ATREFPGRVPAELRSSFDLDLPEGDAELSRSELLARAAGCDGLMVTLRETVDGELLDAAGPRLRCVATFSVGLDHVDLAAATERGVVVANTPGVLTLPTAELSIALLLALVRRVAEGDRLLRTGRPWSWAPSFLLGRGLAGLTLGCIGFGRIGRETARLAEAFGMQVVHTSRHGAGEPGWRPLDELLAIADVVSLHCPLTPETEHLIDAAALARMKPSAVLVNASRGPVVDEAALVDALRAGVIAGAALDVFEREPDVHPGLLELENVVLAPHLGSATVQTREAMGMLCVDALRAVLLEGRAAGNCVNPEALRRGLLA